MAMHVITNPFDTRKGPCEIFSSLSHETQSNRLCGITGKHARSPTITQQLRPCVKQNPPADCPGNPGGALPPGHRQSAPNNKLYSVRFDPQSAHRIKFIIGGRLPVT